MLDFPKQNQHIFFVSDSKEITATSYKVKPDDDDEDDYSDSGNPVTQRTKQDAKYAQEKERYIE